MARKPVSSRKASKKKPPAAAKAPPQKPAISNATIAASLEQYAIRDALKRAKDGEALKPSDLKLIERLKASAPEKKEAAPPQPGEKKSRAEYMRNYRKGKQEESDPAPSRATNVLKFPVVDKSRAETKAERVARVGPQLLDVLEDEAFNGKGIARIAAIKEWFAQTSNVVETNNETIEVEFDPKGQDSQAPEIKEASA